MRYAILCGDVQRPTHTLHGGTGGTKDKDAGSLVDALGCMLGAVPLDRSSDVLASPRGIQLFSELRDRIDPKTVEDCGER